MRSDDEETGAPSGAEVARRVLEFWDRSGIPARAYAGTSDGPVFRFTEGPPGVNGPPHLGHVEPRVLKDVQLRYRRMRGYRIVSPMGGWDCHGLPVEIAIEKKNGLKSRKEIEAFGIDRFCEECREIALQSASAWTEMSRRQGFWLDYEHAYRTMDPPYIESVWWALKSLFEKGLLEKGHYVLPYCPRCETTLSSHEVAQGYRETTDPSITVRFPLVDDPRDLLVWTTTPWTLPANLFVVAHPDLEYSVVHLPEGRDVILASEAVSRYFPGGAEVVARLRASDLAGRAYEPPFSTPGPGKGRHRIVLDPFVTASEGTGIVHGAPSFGPDDYRIGAREKLGVYDPLDNRGVFGDALEMVRGRSFKQADPLLIHDLVERGRMFRSETLKHTYPFCWRCDHALLYRAIDSWFVRTSRLTDALVRNNARTEWVPDYLRDGRFGNFLTAAKDWALSRSRYWGTPLPVWTCPAGHGTCIGSFAELAERSGAPLPSPFDPHRVTVDRISVRCATCGAPARREPYTVDVWFDAGSAPFAQFHYPFEPGPFEPAAPLDYVSEAIDQTRGWYYTLLVISTALFDRAAFQHNLTCEFLLEETGRKMSKSKGKVLEPLEILDRYGADAIRWLFLSQDFTAPIRVGESTLEKAGHRTLGAFRNVVAFHVDNARADGLATPTARPAPSALLDRWLLSRLEATREVVTAALESYDPRPAAGALRDFVDDLSTWYLRRSRPRFWAPADRPDRQEAHATLAYTLGEVARIASPFVPFTTEWAFQEVTGRRFSDPSASVHFTGWPEPSPGREPRIENGMTELRALVEVGRELRQRARVRARIPLAELVLFGEAPPALAQLGNEGLGLLADELNVKQVRRSEAFDPAAFPEADWVVREDDGRPVAALPRQPTPALLEEGLAREVARRLQQTRKALGLRYLDPVAITVSATGPIGAAVAARRSSLAEDLLADPLELTADPLPDGPEVHRFDVDGAVFSARLVRKTA